MGMHISEKHAL